MKSFLKRFIDEELPIKNENRALLFEQLRKVDESRLVFLATVASVAIVLMQVLNFTYFDDSLLHFYMATDGTMFLASIVLLVVNHFTKSSSNIRYSKFRKIVFDSYPLFMITWATVIFALDTKSFLNVIALCFMLFFIAFALVTTVKRFLVFYLLSLSEYLLITYLMGTPFLSDNTIIIVAVCLFILPFVYSFRNNRINAQSAIIALSESKQNLSNEVQKRTQELKTTNENLEYEVNQRRMTEVKLRDALLAAEENNKLKSEFLANISHEIRTPLNSIIGFTEMITEDSVGPVEKKMFQGLVASNTMYLLSTIDDIFDASLVNTKQIKPINKPLKINPFLESVRYETTGITTKYSKDGIEFVVKMLPDNSMFMVTDEFFLKKALLRLIDNAFKFTNEGLVELGAKCFGNTISFYVKDTGIGIKPNDHYRIFEPFVQGDGSFTRGYGGSGLGLSIANGIVKSLGGKLSFTSELGKGSEFTVTFANYRKQ